jgi:hypothetical protein
LEKVSEARLKEEASLSLSIVAVDMARHASNDMLVVGSVTICATNNSGLVFCTGGKVDVIAVQLRSELRPLISPLSFILHY